MHGIQKAATSMFPPACSAAGRNFEASTVNEAYSEYKFTYVIGWVRLHESDSLQAAGALTSAPFE